MKQLVYKHQEKVSKDHAVIRWPFKLWVMIDQLTCLFGYICTTCTNECDTRWSPICLLRQVDGKSIDSLDEEVLHRAICTQWGRKSFADIVVVAFWSALKITKVINFNINTVNTGGTNSEVRWHKKNCLYSYIQVIGEQCACKWVTSLYRELILVWSLIGGVVLMSDVTRELIPVSSLVDGVVFFYFFCNLNIIKVKVHFVIYIADQKATTRT